MDDIKDYIARRAAKELCDGNIVNLGIGIPTMVANYLPDGISIQLQSENGILGLGPESCNYQVDPSITNANGKPASILAGGAFFDSSTSFGIIRGGHLDITILGALQVDEYGNLANWIIPGKLVPGMGGAMDLVVGAKKVIVAMEHTNKGIPKIKKRCSLPLTAESCVDMIITEMCVMQYKNGHLYLTEINPAYSLDQVRQATEAEFIIAI